MTLTYTLIHNETILQNKKTNRPHIQPLVFSFSLYKFIDSTKLASNGMGYPLRLSHSPLHRLRRLALLVGDTPNPGEIRFAVFPTPDGMAIQTLRFH